MDNNYKNNAYYKCLYEALMSAFIKNKINPNKNYYDSETTWNNSYYTYLATLDFCENLTMYCDDYSHFNLEKSFSEIRNCTLDRINAGKQLISTTQK